MNGNPLFICSFFYEKNNYCFSAVLTGQVDTPSTLYNPQNPVNTVINAIAAIMSNIIPKVPSTILVKYNIARTAATMILIILSVFPMFFFIMIFLSLISLLFLNNKLF